MVSVGASGDSLASGLGGGGGGGGGGEPDAATFQPMTSSTVSSVGVTGSTTRDLAKARNASLPALEAQSARSPPGLLLKPSRLVVPPLIEKYPGCAPDMSRTPAAEKSNRESGV